MDPLSLRFVERITAVLIGGLAIYLGYRLFISVPELRDSAGNIKLPWNISVVMTRVGPGVFFALFGSAAVCLALARPISIQPATGNVTYAAAELTPSGLSSSQDARALMRREMAALNTVPGALRPDLSLQARADFVRGIRRTKLLLMKPVWGTPQEGFGDFSAFESWVEAGEGGHPPEGMSGALELYRYGETQ